MLRTTEPENTAPAGGGWCLLISDQSPADFRLVQVQETREMRAERSASSCLPACWRVSVKSRGVRLHCDAQVLFLMSSVLSAVPNAQSGH